MFLLAVLTLVAPMIAVETLRFDAACQNSLNVSIMSSAAPAVIVSSVSETCFAS